MADVAIDAVGKSDDFVDSRVYTEQRKASDDRIGELRDEVHALKEYVTSDRLPAAIANAILRSSQRLHVTDDRS